jgi:nucleoside-diphosphate-sugar epimerase
MTTGLIGYTGLVGSNLAGQRGFERRYNRANIEEIRGRRFTLLVNSGVSAVKWKANEEPDADRAAILALWRELETVEADVFVQVSTLDVMPRGTVYEDTPIDEARLEPYGRNRLALERLVAERFPRRLIVRLPHIFGPGLKKGFVYDLIHANALHLTDRRDVFQPYDLAWLWRDLHTFLERGWEVVNLATEPITASDLAREAFGIEFGNECDREPRVYDMRTRHGPDYLYGWDEVVDALRRFREAQ